MRFSRIAALVVSTLVTAVLPSVGPVSAASGAVVGHGPTLATAVCVAGDDHAVSALPCAPGEHRLSLRLNRRNVFCVGGDGSVRKIQSGYCAGTPLKLPRAQTDYFCALPADGALRRVTAPGKCGQGAQRLYVVDRAPSAPELSSQAVAENLPKHSLVATLSAHDPDLGDHVRFHFATGAGATDNGAFAIVGSRILLRRTADFEAKQHYSVRIEGRDRRRVGSERAFVIDVTDVNERPTAITLDRSTVPAQTAAKVGTLAMADPDAGDHASYAVMAGGASFEVRNGNELWSRTGVTSGSPVTVRATDIGGLSVDQLFAITVTSVNRAPTAIALDHSTVPEQTVAKVGALSSSDPDAGDSATYALLTGGSDFELLSGNQLWTTHKLALADGPFTVRIRVTDGGGLAFERDLDITLDDVNLAPDALDLTDDLVAENTVAKVGDLTSHDLDAGDTATYTVTAGGSDFEVKNGDELWTRQGLDHEAAATEPVSVQVSDGGGLSFDRTFTITVDDVNEAPGTIDLTGTSVAENSVARVGTLTSTDPDAGDTAGYSVVAGGSDFEVKNGDELWTKQGLDHEAASPWTATVRVTDTAGLNKDVIFTITVTDVDEAPDAISLSDTSVDENAVVKIADLSSHDVDAGDTASYAVTAGGSDFEVKNGDELWTKRALDHEATPTLPVTVTATDSGSLTFDQALTITVADVDEAPTGLTLSNDHVAENLASGTTVGTLSATDPESGALTWSLVPGAADNADFTVTAAGVLKTATGFDFESDDTYTVRAAVSDGPNAPEKTFTIHVDDANDAPTAVNPTDSTVLEHLPTGTVVTTLTADDQDALDTHTFTLVAGAGSSDNGSFAISGSSLTTNAVFDHLTKDTYLVRVRATDAGGKLVESQLTVHVDNVNDAPTGLSLDVADVAENQPAGTLVGSFTPVDPDGAAPYTYALVAGAGAGDNAKFAVSGGQLRSGQVFDRETTSSYAVRVQVTDNGGLSFEKSFTITVTDVNEQPTGPTLADNHVDENVPAGTTVGTLASTDADAGDGATYTLVAGAGSTDNGEFTIVGSSLRTNAGVDFETQSSYDVRVRVTDNGALTSEATFTIHVDDVDDAPTAVALADSHVDEHQPAGTAVGTLDAADQDAGDTHTFALVAGAGSADNASFTIAGDTLNTAATFDYLTKAIYLIRVQATDGAGQVVETQLTVTVDNVNDAPTALDLDSTSVPENQSVGSVVGTFSPTDPDGVAPYTYTLVAGTGSADNASFDTANGTLTTAAPFDYDSRTSYSVRVRVTDAGGLTFERAFAVTVTNVNEQPTGPTLADNHVNENAAVGTAVGTLASTDPDAGDGATYTLVVGTGSTDNAQFTITGSSLNTAAVFDFETKATYAVRVRVTDAGGLTSETQLTILVDNVNDPPVAVTDFYSGVIGNTKATVGTVTTAAPKVALSGNVPLANDTDQDAGDTLSITAGTLTTTRGGSVTIDAAGNFVYLPKVGDKSLTDYFTYTLSDGHVTASGTVGLDIGASLVWYVDRAVAGAGAGTSSSPFSSLSSLVGAADPDGTGDTIFMYGNATAYALGLTLETDQQLYGQSVGLIIGGTTLVPAAGTNPTITTGTSAPSLTLATGTYVNGITTTNGITAPSVDGAILDTATRLSGTPTAYALSVTGGTTGTIAVQGNITSTSTGRALQISGRTGGAVNVTGTMTGGGVSLTSNPGTTVTLSGGVNLTTTNEPAFVASGGGTVTVTGAANTISTSGWTGLSVTNTSIGAAGLTFRSVRAVGTGTVFPANGIVLTNTGSLGSLTVTGNGGAAAGTSGSCGRGTAADCSGGSLSQTTGPAVLLSNTRAPSLTRVEVSGAKADGLLATSVDGLTIENSKITSNGDAADEGNIDLGDSTSVAPTGWSGTATISNSYLSFAFDGDIVAGNSSGTAALVVSSTWAFIAGVSGSGASMDGLQVRALGTAHLAVDVTGSAFNNNYGDHIQVVASDNATLDHVTITGNQLVGNTTPASQAVVISASGLPWTGSAAFNISNNTISDVIGGAIVVTAAGTSSGSLFAGTIANNTIGVSTRAKSCSLTTSGIKVANRDGAGTATVAVTGNTISRCADRGIDVAAGAGANVLNLTVTGNTTTTNAGDNDAANGLTRQGFYANMGLSSSDASTSCLDVRGNSFQTGTQVSMGLYIQHRFGGLRIPGYVGPAAAGSGAAVAAYVGPLNTAPTVTQATDPGAGGSYAGGAACPLP